MATATRRIARTTKKGSTGAFDVVRKLKDFLTVKTEVKVLAKRETALKDDLSEFVDENGYTDDRGHIWFDLPEVVEALDENGKTVLYNRIQRQRRVGEQFNADAAETILEKKKIKDACSKSYLQVVDPDKAIAVLKKHGLLDQGFEVITEIDADEVRKAFYQKLITPAEYKRIFTQKITWAFLPSPVK